MRADGFPLPERLRIVAPKIALGQDDPEIETLSDRIAAAIDPPETAHFPVLDPLAAIECIPAAWRGSIRIEFGEHVFGGRRYTVELRRRAGIAVGSGPWLPAAILEAAIAAHISEATK